MFTKEHVGGDAESDRGDSGKSKDSNLGNERRVCIFILFHKINYVSVHQFKSCILVISFKIYEQKDGCLI